MHRDIHWWYHFVNVEELPIFFFLFLFFPFKIYSPITLLNQSISSFALFEIVFTCSFNGSRIFSWFQRKISDFPSISSNISHQCLPINIIEQWDIKYKNAITINAFDVYVQMANGPANLMPFRFIFFFFFDHLFIRAIEGIIMSYNIESFLSIFCQVRYWIMHSDRFAPFIHLACRYSFACRKNPFSMAVSVYLFHCIFIV